MRRARLVYTYITSIVITQCLTAVRNDDGFCVRNVTGSSFFRLMLRLPWSLFAFFIFILVPLSCHGNVRWLKLGLYRFFRNTLLYNVKCRHMSSVESLNFLMLHSSGQFGRSFHITSSLMLSFGLFSICLQRAFHCYNTTSTLPVIAYISNIKLARKCTRVLAYYTV